MNIYGSLMDIFEKNKDIYVEHCFMRQPNPERGLFMDIQKINL